MRYSLNSFKAGYIGDFFSGTTIGVIKGDTRSLDYSSYGGKLLNLFWPFEAFWIRIRFE